MFHFLCTVYMREYKIVLYIGGSTLLMGRAWMNVTYQRNNYCTNNVYTCKVQVQIEIQRETCWLIAHE